MSLKLETKGNEYCNLMYASEVYIYGVEDDEPSIKCNSSYHSATLEQCNYHKFSGFLSWNCQAGKLFSFIAYIAHIEKEQLAFSE